MKTVWTRLAVKDLLQLREYIAKDNPEAAQSLLERIADAVDNLLSYHQMGRLGRVKGTRELIIAGTPLTIPYRIKKEQIEILAVLHSARRWPGNF